jgi:RHS repeat-associated protein
MHEHLDDFALINMNGRVYDPQIARFLSPDPQLQAPGYWLNYNRYGYCWNNPLIYTDPTGEFPWLFAIGALIGAYIGGSAINDDWCPWDGGWDWSDAGTYFGIIGGALAGGLVIQSAFGAGGWLAGGQGLSVNIGAGFEGIQAFTQMTINSGIVTWEGLGYTTIAGGGMWLSSNYLKGKEPNGPFVDMTMVNQGRYEAQSQGGFVGGDTWNSTSNHLNGAGFTAAGAEYSGSRALSRTMKYVSTASKTTPTEVMFKVPGGSVYASTRFVSNATKVLKVGGAATGVPGFGMTGYEIYTGQKSLMGEGGLDLIMGGVAFIPGGGWIVSGAYFGGKFLLEATGNDFWNEP